MNTYQEQVFDANGVRINYIQASAAGRPLVLLHGAGSEWQSFLPLIPVFENNFQVFALDLRGHGRSSWVRGKYRLLDYAEDVQCFLDRHVGQPSILYGHSLGAQISIAAAAESPRLACALILGDPAFYFHRMATRESVWHEAFVELHHVISTMHSAPEMDDYMARQYPGMEPQRRKARAETMSHIDPGVIEAILEDRHLEGFNADLFLRRITCPVLIVQGNPGLGAALRDEDLAYMTERLRNYDVLHMQDVGHGLPTARTLSRLEAFLASI
ncbi:MAG: alpha/beta fold hydrolase [Bacteroidota bacterium]